jgi:hypothetical protein
MEQLVPSRYLMPIVRRRFVAGALAISGIGSPSWGWSSLAS